MDPLRDVEDRKAQLDLGVLGARVFLGALGELEGNILHAYLVTCAFFKGMNQDIKQDEDDSSSDHSD